MKPGDATTNEKLFDAAVRHQIHLERYKTSLVRRMGRLLDLADHDLAGQIDRNAGRGLSTFNQARRQAVLNAVRRVNTAVYDRLGKALTAEMIELAGREAEFNLASLRDAVPIEFDMATPARSLLEAAVTTDPLRGKLLKEWVKDLSDGRYRRLRDAINVGIVEGETVEQMIARIIGTRANNYKDGIIEASRRDAAAIVRTAVNHVSSRARELTYAENEDLISGVQWVSTLDSRTSPVCRERDGKVYELSKGPRPPAHINCRSTVVAVVKSWRELGVDLDEAPEGTRASMDGQVPADTRYEDWLRKQPQHVVEDVLGQRKAALFLDGHLTLDRFVDDTGKELTLEQLAAKHQGSAAWARAYGAAEAPPRIRVTAESFAEVGPQLRADVTPALLRTWNERIPQTPQQVYDRLAKAMPGRTSLTIAPRGADGLALSLRSTGPGDVEVEARRTVDFANRAVDHALFQMTEAGQGKGTAKRFLKASFELYQDWGIETVTVHAGLDRGGYTWAKFGFVPTQPAWETLRKELRGELDDLVANRRLAKKDADAARVFLKSDDPRSIWAIADLKAPVGDAPLGKVLLSGSDWRGTFRLDDRKAMTRFKLYIRERKPDA